VNWLRQKYRLTVLLVRVWLLNRGLKSGGNIMELVLGVLRALLAAVGGYIVNKGIADQATVDALIGALIVLVTGGWSVWSKVKTKKA
jgi:hypothetical protein